MLGSRPSKELLTLVDKQLEKAKEKRFQINRSIKEKMRLIDLVLQTGKSVYCGQCRACFRCDAALWRKAILKEAFE